MIIFEFIIKSNSETPQPAFLTVAVQFEAIYHTVV